MSSKRIKLESEEVAEETDWRALYGAFSDWLSEMESVFIIAGDDKKTAFDRLSKDEQMAVVEVNIFLH